MSTYLILSKYFITHEIILASNKFWYSLHHGCNTDTGLGHFCEGLLFPLEQKCPDMKVLGVLCVFLPWREIAVKQVFFFVIVLFLILEFQYFKVVFRDQQILSSVNQWLAQEALNCHWIKNAYNPALHCQY